VRFLAWAIVWSACVSAIGCASLNPKNWKAPSLGAKRSKGEAGGERIPAPDPPVAPLAGRNGGRNSNNGLLAGQVIDSFNQRQGGAVIQVAAADASPNEQPQEATSNEQGYFTIQGLQVGRRYKLLARTKKGEQLLAGTAIATPPNAVVLIKVSEDFANPGTPDIPGPADVTDKSSPPPKPRQPTKPAASIDSGQGISKAPKYLHEPDRGYADRSRQFGPNTVPPAPNSARLGVPVAPERPTESIEPRPPRAQVRPEYQTQDGLPSLAATSPGMPLRIQNQTPPFPGASSTAAPLAQSAVGTQRSGPALPAPGCVLTGNRVENFALNDLQGTPYQLKDHQARLVLLDFWGTWCQPCIQAMPQMEELNRRYGPRGLEIIGIAYESDGTFLEKAQRVNFVRQRQGVTYKMLLGEGDNCPVRTKLGVNAFPTLVLLDANGTILWRAEGLTPQNKSALENEIRRRLSD
jgi:thiol-disulfide isomerase/thioredoxin